MWGLVRTAVLELDPKQIFAICVDTNASFDGETLANQVRREVLSPAESEISYRGDRRFVRRLAVGQKFSGEDVELVVGRAGLESLSISPIPSDRFAGAIPDGSVEVSIYSTGLNFKVISLAVIDWILRRTLCSFSPFFFLRTQGRSQRHLP